MRMRLHLRRRPEGVQIHVGILEGKRQRLLCAEPQEALSSEAHPHLCGMRLPNTQSIVSEHNCTGVVQGSQEKA